MFYVDFWGSEDNMPKNEGYSTTCLPQLVMFFKGGNK